ncbi:tautomerase family protein [Carnobacterium maltaromaticum]|uniref:tautomerase family protein n=1 Tax=Carnobacterium maltaromaticum TaxID=2751 RepID=UPI0039AFF079
MPLIQIDLIEGRTDSEIKLLLDTIHEVLVETFEIPINDRFQILHQHSANEMIIEDTGLGFKRSQNVVVLSITSRQRKEKQKVDFYQKVVQALTNCCGIAPEDVMISITINEQADWSFGFGRAQFLTGEL